MGRIYSTHITEDKFVQNILVGILEGREHSQNLSVHGREISEGTVVK